MLPANKGQRCKRWGRKYGRLYCKRFTYPKRRFQMGFRSGHTPANYGATCVRRQHVWSPWYNKKVWRCAKYGPGGGSGSRSRLFSPRPPASPMVVRLPFKTRSEDRNEARTPLSLRSMERLAAGRTPL